MISSEKALTQAAQSQANQFPLKPLQQSMALASIRAPRSGVYILQDVCEFEKDLDTELLREAWEFIVAKYPALRTRIVRLGAGALEAAVESEARIIWRDIDASDPSKYLQEDRDNGFDFADGVPARIAVLRGAGRSWVILTIHHALVDGRSLFIIWHEWMAVYDALRRNENPEFSPQEARGGELDEPAEAEHFWHKLFAGVTETTDFIVDRISNEGRAESIAASFRKESSTLSPELSEEIAALAISHAVTVNNLVQAAWALLLSRYSGREDVVFGVTRTGRGAGTENQVGFFLCTLPFRVAVPQDVTLGEWLKQIREQWVEQREHQHTSLERIAEWSGLPAGTRLFDTVLNYDHAPPGESLRKLDGWERRKLHRLQRTDSPMTLVAYGSPAVTFEIVYDSRRFGRNIVSGMVRHLETLLRSFAEQPDSTLGAIKMVAGAEERRLLEHTNTTYPHELCVHELFEEQARLRPAEIALDAAGESISYHELNKRANQAGRYLRENGVGPEDFVAVCFPRSPQAVIAVLGVLKSGAAFVPLDPNVPEERLASMIAEAGVKLVLSDRIMAGPSRTVLLSEIAGGSKANLEKVGVANNAAYAIYTSGSTGKPKAVVVTHRSLVNHTLAVQRIYGLSEKDRRLQFASPGTDVFVAEVFNYLCCGATLVFAMEHREVSIRYFVQVLDEHRITITGLPSTWWHEWVEAMKNGMALPRSLRAVIAGMEQVNAAAFLKWRQMTEGEIRWFNAYGPTETTCTALIYEAGSSEWEGASFVPIGRPVANARAYALDRSGNLLPDGIAGELYISGIGVARGYLNDPEQTARKFLPDPFHRADFPDHSDSRMYRTGDMVFRLPDGNFVFLGRADRQVKIRGYRIELEEIEGALIEHGGVRQCAVIARNRENSASGHDSLIAYYVASALETPGATELRLYLARRLPAHMIPAKFVMLAEMPRTVSGKIDRVALSSYEVDSRPDTIEIAGEEAEGQEEQLARLWEEALGIKRVGLTDDFFELGGDSLNAVRLITLIHAQFKKEISFEDLLLAPTVEKMAIILRGGSAGNLISLEARGSRIPLFCITTTLKGHTCYRHLARLLGDDQPFLAVPHPLLEGQGLEQVKNLANQFSTEIRQFKPHGPYVLGGHCLGGTIAFEAAQKLLAEGEKVPLVVLFDSPTPGYPKLTPGRMHYWQRLRRVAAGEKIEWKEIVPHFVMIGKLLRKRASSQAQYTPPAAAIDVAQFIAKDAPISAQVLEDMRLGWRDFCKGRFTVHEADGKHNTMFQEPNVQGLAAKLSELLCELNGQEISAR